MPESAPGSSADLRQKLAVLPEFQRAKQRADAVDADFQLATRWTPLRIRVIVLRVMRGG